MNPRFKVVVVHGENGSIFNVVDMFAPKSEQPSIMFSLNSKKEPKARFLAEDFCHRHNSK